MQMVYYKFSKMDLDFYAQREVHILQGLMIFMFHPVKLDALLLEQVTIFLGKSDLLKMENVILHYSRLMKLILKRLIRQKEKFYTKT